MSTYGDQLDDETIQIVAGPRFVEDPAIEMLVAPYAKGKGEYNADIESMSAYRDKAVVEIEELQNNNRYRKELHLRRDVRASSKRTKRIDSRDNERISSGDQHLSFGEKNAFALVLFMYQSLADKADLIVLDDPISSFDKNKKHR